MYAVIATGGKQYKVSLGDQLKVEKLPATVGEMVKFPVLLWAKEASTLQTGTPIISSISVQAEVLSHGRDKKIKIIKFRRRKHHRKQMGHRQYYTAVKIREFLEQ
jgi:large subunit ribosomal protein L21